MKKTNGDVKFHFFLKQGNQHQLEPPSVRTQDGESISTSSWTFPSIQDSPGPSQLKVTVHAEVPYYCT